MENDDLQIENEGLKMENMYLKNEFISNLSEIKEIYEEEIFTIFPQ